MGLNVPANTVYPEIVGSAGYGAPRIGYAGGIAQGARIGYRVSKYLYRRYFKFATKTRSRSAGTATGAGHQ